MYSADENVKLDYNLVLLKHLDRMSNLTTTMLGEMLNSQGYVIGDRDGDKYDSFFWAVKYLMAIIPDELIDDEHKEVEKKIENNYDERTRNLKDNEGKFDNIKFKYIRSQRDVALFHNCINLLARKGFLFETGGIMKLAKPKTMTNEEWDT